MKLIIDIDEKKYEEIKRIAKAQFDLTDKTEAQIIANGTPVSNEGDLISREALKKHITDIFEREVKIDEKWARGLKYSLKVIDKAPTIERPQGEWKEFKYGLYYCSRCFERVDKDIERIETLVSKGERSNYCPVCGATMGGTT